MKSFTWMALMALVGTLAFGADPKPYDSAAMVEIMHSNGAQAGAVGKAIAAGDWPAVTAGFQVLAQNAQKARQYAPPKGDPKVWAQIWDDFFAGTQKGLAAAAAKDPVKAKEALAQLTADRNAGHGKFKG